MRSHSYSKWVVDGSKESIATNISFKNYIESKLDAESSHLNNQAHFITYGDTEGKVVISTLLK